MSNSLSKMEASSLLELASKYAADFENVITYTNSERELITISGDKGGKHYSLTIQQTNHGEIRSVSAYDASRPKSEYVEDIQRMRELGMTQVEIARRLGMSQAMVSKLVGKKRER